jgi:hypothetical protein
VPSNRGTLVIGGNRPAFAANAAAGRLRASNAVARLRAGRLVAVGDRHLRASVANPAKLLAALDAYRRAATVAPDLPDTFVRQAIVLTALDRRADAGHAIERAVAIDGRLGSGPPALAPALAPAAMAAVDRLPPDPVFGESRADDPPALAARSGELLGRIFAEEQGAAAEPNHRPQNDRLDGNWIAERWSQQWPGVANALARK